MLLLIIFTFDYFLLLPPFSPFLVLLAVVFYDEVWWGEVICMNLAWQSWRHQGCVDSVVLTAMTCCHSWALCETKQSCFITISSHLFCRCCVCAVLQSDSAVHWPDQPPRQKQNVQEGVYQEHSPSSTQCLRWLRRPPLWQHIPDWSCGCVAPPISHPVEILI